MKAIVAIPLPCLAAATTELLIGTVILSPAPSHSPRRWAMVWPSALGVGTRRAWEALCPVPIS